MKDAFPIPERPNCIYSRREVVAPLLEASKRRRYVDHVTQDWREDGKKCPDGDTIFWRLRALSWFSVLYYFMKINYMILTIAKNMGLLPREAILATDLHDAPYYGKDLRQTVGTKRLRGTNYAHRIATIDIVLKGKRLVLYAVPVFQWTPLHTVLEILIQMSLCWVDISLLLADKGYYDSKCLKVMDKYNINYVIPALRNKRVMKHVEMGRKPEHWFAQIEDYYHVADYDLEDVPTNLAILYRPNEKKEKKKTFPFITNIRTNCIDVPFLANEYRKRWGIETAYRKEEEIRARTNCLYYPIRLFFLLIMVLLYNLWMLINAIIIENGYVFKEHYPITMHKFLNLLANVIR